ncbi:hypothetical protein [Aquiflexum sp.]|uniref:hypothetical protein n=1 Tax=Aquiflexum sp. TaxID=1872584 RepID=UPI0035930CF0
MKHLFQIFGLLVILFSCNSKSENPNLIADYHFEIKDSIQVDYLGNLSVFDFEPESGFYLGRNNSTEEHLLFDDQGKIHNRFIIQKDGPDAVSWVQGLGFLDGKITVMDSNKGILQFSNEGEIANRIELPEDYFFINGLNFPAARFGNELMYIRPERDGMDWSNLGELFKRVYQNPILEVYNPETGIIRNTMNFPPRTTYTDGNYYHWMFPSLIQVSDSEWLLYLMAERKYYVYKKVGDQLIYEKTVDLKINDAVNIQGGPIENLEVMYEGNRFNIFGKIEQIYSREQDILVVYTKGVDEEIVKQYDPENIVEWMTFINSIPRYMAVLDKNHQMLQKDIPVPLGIDFTSVCNSKGEIIVLKNQEYFGMEEDFTTFYKMNQVK